MLGPKEGCQVNPSPGPWPCCTQFSTLSEATSYYVYTLEFSDCLFFYTEIFMFFLLFEFATFVLLAVFFLVAIAFVCLLALFYSQYYNSRRSTTILLTQEYLMEDNIPCSQLGLVGFSKDGELEMFRRAHPGAGHVQLSVAEDLPTQPHPHILE